MLDGNERHGFGNLVPLLPDSQGQQSIRNLQDQSALKFHSAAEELIGGGVRHRRKLSSSIQDALFPPPAVMIVDPLLYPGAQSLSVLNRLEQLFPADVDGCREEVA